MTKRKHALLTGGTSETTHKTLKCIQAHGAKGDWRRTHVARVKCRKCFMAFCKDNDGNERLSFTIKTTVPSGMTSLVNKS